MEDVRRRCTPLKRRSNSTVNKKTPWIKQSPVLEAQREATQQQLRELEQQLQDKIPAEEIVSTLKTIDVLAQKSVSADTEKRTNEDKQQRITQQLAALEKKTKYIGSASITCATNRLLMAPNENSQRPIWLLASLSRMGRKRMHEPTRTSQRLSPRLRGPKRGRDTAAARDAGSTLRRIRQQ